MSSEILDFAAHLKKKSAEGEAEEERFTKLAAEYQGKTAGTRKLLDAAADMIIKLEGDIRERDEANRLLKEQIGSTREGSRGAGGTTVGQGEPGSPWSPGPTRATSETAAAGNKGFASSPVARAIALLEAEVSKAVSLLVDAYMCRHIAGDVQPKYVEKYMPEATDIFGEDLAKELGNYSQRPSLHGALGRHLVRVLMHLFLFKHCERVYQARPDSWIRAPDLKRLEELFDVISGGSERLRTSMDEWRTSHYHILEPSLKWWTTYTTKMLEIHMLFLGWAFRTSKESTPFEESLPAIFYAICDLRRTLAREINSSGEDLEIYMIEKGELYDPAQMEAYPSGITQSRSIGEKVVGPSGFGMRRVSPVKTKSGAYERKVENLIMPKVVYGNMVEVAETMHRHERFDG